MAFRLVGVGLERVAVGGCRGFEGGRLCSGWWVGLIGEVFGLVEC